MLAKLNDCVLTSDGVPFEKSPSDKSAATVGWLCVKAVLDCRSSSEATGTVKYARASIAAKLMDKESADLTIDELKTVKDCVGEAFGPWIVRQIWDALERRSDGSGGG